MVRDNVYSKNYWNNAAKSNPFARILSNYNEEKFWKTQPKIPGLMKNMIFLDFGCGIGRIARSVAPLVKEYYGVDFSREMVGKAKSYHKDYNNVQFFVNNGCDLSIFENNTFDFVYSCLVFQHIHKEPGVKYISEIYRVLKPTGVFWEANFPKKEQYCEGFSTKEVQEIFSDFKEVNTEGTGKWYYSIRCRK